jgi:TetR/AcrR family transcriptional repressor of lmrAB and yxaGH operons
MIEAAVDGLRRSGAAAMSFTEVLKASGAARGAIYHHFPGGKAELMTDAATRNGAEIRDHLTRLPDTNPLATVSGFFDAVRPVIAESTHGSGCAIAAVTSGVDREQEAGLRAIAAAVFGSWTAALTEALARAGMTDDEAADLATTLIVALEGAHILCRATGTLDAFERVRRTIITITASRGTGGLAANVPPTGVRRMV